MNIENANTEPYYQFLRFHENFGSNLKLTLGALQTLKLNEESAPSREGSGVTLLPTGGEPWGPSTKWKGFKHRLPPVSRLLSQMGIVRVASAFEDFLSNVTSEHSRYSDFSGKTTAGKRTEAENSDGGEVLRSLYASLGWDIKPVEFLLPLFDYFILARNCIAHRSGRASRRLVEYSKSTLLMECIHAWESKLPQLPQIQEGEDIPFLPRHAIQFSEVCLRAAREVNSLLLSFLGVEGSVYLAAYHGLLADNHIRTGAWRSPEQIINLILTERCRIQVADKFEVIKILKDLGQWDDCRTKYDKLYPKVR